MKQVEDSIIDRLDLGVWDQVRDQVLEQVNYQAPKRWLQQ